MPVGVSASSQEAELAGSGEDTDHAETRPVLRRSLDLPRSSDPPDGVECSCGCLRAAFSNIILWPCWYMCCALLTILFYDCVNPLPTSFVPTNLMKVCFKQLGFRSDESMWIVELFVIFYVSTSLFLVPYRIHKFGTFGAMSGCLAGCVVYTLIYCSSVKWLDFASGNEMSVTGLAFVVMWVSNMIAAMVMEILGERKDRTCSSKLYHALQQGTASTMLRASAFTTFLVSMKMVRNHAIKSNWWANTLASSLVPKVLCIFFSMNYRKDIKTHTYDDEEDRHELVHIVLRTMLLEGLSKYIAFQNAQIYQLTATFVVQAAVEIASWSALAVVSGRQGTDLKDHLDNVIIDIDQGETTIAEGARQAVDGVHIHVESALQDLRGDNRLISGHTAFKIAAEKSWLALHRGWYEFAECWVLIVAAYCSCMRHGSWHSRILRLHGLIICLVVEVCADVILHFVFDYHKVKVVKPTPLWGTGLLFTWVICCVMNFDYFCWCHWECFDWPVKWCSQAEVETH